MVVPIPQQVGQVGENGSDPILEFEKAGSDPFSWFAGIGSYPITCQAQFKERIERL
jgi:hypothetical protein